MYGSSCRVKGLVLMVKDLGFMVLALKGYLYNSIYIFMYGLSGSWKRGGQKKTE